MNVRNMTPRLNKSMLNDDLDNLDDNDIELRINHPNRNLTNSRLDNEDQDLEDFNSRLAKLEERLQTSLIERNKRNPSRNNNKSPSSWKLDFPNPDYKSPSKSPNLYLRTEKDGMYQPPLQRKSMTPTQWKGRNRKDLIQEYNQKAGFEPFEDTLFVNNRVPHRRPVRNTSPHKVLTPDITHNNKYSNIKSKDINLSSGKILDMDQSIYK
jgi:hypothetical protein